MTSHPQSPITQVVADLLGMRERGDWKSCKVGKEEEEAMVEGLKARFQPYDIM